MPLNLPFINRRDPKPEAETEIDTTNIPKHIAIIMDGNGRWAKDKGLPRIAGHKEGMDVVKKVVRHASDLGVEVLTLYAFSTENWKRPKKEVDFLMKLPVDFLQTYLPELVENNIRVQTIGTKDLLPKHTQKAVDEAIHRTENNSGMVLNFALNYGSRNEIVEVTRMLASKVEEGELAADSITEETFNSYLYTSHLCEPDLLIRTSGEQRLSNFLLWQLAYAEFWFTEVYWPSFTEYTLNEAIINYQNRKRRYGGV
ncbi:MULTISPECIES: isoprenyl transferase [Salimicrobium]|nr:MULTISPECIES: isoprenyl transferase [Salimicrobium]EKE32765.1 undecaprenyl pyrophosphate synthase [Salimicrobium jeotgali]MBM7695247.1 undecaprenyl diphosphate synthase [Salimicrobium jeotgali]SDX30462.1 undecaprenyl diphosphate synthase [Salimicrobium album]SIS63892.1 Undecaprenyl pyrophosphate synthetase [Salimicrobium salexigens]